MDVEDVGCLEDAGIEEPDADMEMSRKGMETTTDCVMELPPDVMDQDDEEWLRMAGVIGMDQDSDMPTAPGSPTTSAAPRYLSSTAQKNALLLVQQEARFLHNHYEDTEQGNELMLRGLNHAEKEDALLSGASKVRRLGTGTSDFEQTYADMMRDQEYEPAVPDSESASSSEEPFWDQMEGGWHKKPRRSTEDEMRAAGWHEDGWQEKAESMLRQLWGV